MYLEFESHLCYFHYFAFSESRFLTCASDIMKIIHHALLGRRAMSASLSTRPGGSRLGGRMTASLSRASKVDHDAEGQRGE